MDKTLTELNAEFVAYRAETEAHRAESNRRHNEIFNRLNSFEKEIKSELDNKVSYKIFMLIFTVLSGVLGYMVYQIDTNFRLLNDLAMKTQLDVASVKASISEVQGKLEPYDIEFKH